MLDVTSDRLDIYDIYLLTVKWTSWTGPQILRIVEQGKNDF